MSSAAAFGFFTSFRGWLTSLWASTGQPKEPADDSRINSYALKNPARKSQGVLHSLIGDMHAKVVNAQPKPLLALQQGKQLSMIIQTGVLIKTIPFCTFEKKRPMQNLSLPAVSPVLLQHRNLLNLKYLRFVT